MVWVILVLLIALNGSLGWIVYRLLQRFGSYAQASDKFITNLVQALDQYTQVLNEVARKEIYINDPIIFNLVEQTRNFRDFLGRIMIESYGQQSQPPPLESGGLFPGPPPGA